MTSMNNITRRFLLGEQKGGAGIMSRFLALEETLAALNPHTQTNSRRVEIAREHLREMKKEFRKLEEEKNSLQERLNLLEEDKANAKIEEDYS